MKTINLSEQNSVMNLYLAELRDKDYQQNRLLFRNNLKRIGEIMAFEISKTFDYELKTVHTPLADAEMQLPEDKVVLATVLRAGLPFHEGFLHVFDHAGNAFVSAYRMYTNAEHTEVGVHTEYLVSPDVEGNSASAHVFDAAMGSLVAGSASFAYAMTRMSAASLAMATVPISDSTPDPWTEPRSAIEPHAVAFVPP